MGRKSHDRAMGNGCSLALAMFSPYAVLWDDMLRYAILASVVMNRLLSRGPLGIGSVRVCVCVRVLYVRARECAYESITPDEAADVALQYKDRKLLGRSLRRA